MRPIPKTKANELLDNLECYHVRSKSNSFRLNNDRKEAKNIIQKDPVNAYAVLGAIACLEDDLTQMHRYHKLSISISNREYSSVYNYMASLGKCCLWEEAFNLLISEYPNDKSNLDLLSNTIESAERAGYYHKATELAHQYNKQNIIKSYDETSIDKEISRIMDLHKIQDSDFAKVMSIVSLAFASRGLIVETFRTGINTNNDNPYIYKEFMFSKDINCDLFEIEDDIQAKLLEKIPQHVRDGISIVINNPSVADLIDLMDGNVATNINDLVDPDVNDVAFMKAILKKVESD